MSQIQPQPDQLSGTRPTSTNGQPNILTKLSRRVCRSVLFRSRALLSYARLVRRNLGFPIRNFLLRNRPLSVRAGDLHYLLVPAGSVPLEMWSKRYFERQELEFVVESLQPGMVFVDIGANVGLFSIPAAKKIQHGRVYAFEPTSATFALLTKNVLLNRLENLDAVHSAVADYVGQATLSLNVANKDGLNTIGKPTHEDSEVVGAEAVPVTTLDAFLDAHAIPRVDIIKIDVEGAELLVLRGASRLLSRCDAPLILYESGFLAKGFDYHPVETLWLLERLSYELFVIDPATGRPVSAFASRPYPAMVIAVKPSHPQYPKIKANALESRAR